jgi:uncharacterized protein DUF397
LTKADGSGRWRTSSHCSDGGCVEVGSVDDLVVIRNSTDPNGPRLRLSKERWSAFIAYLKTGAA